MAEAETETLDPAATDITTDNARDGARKRRDPNEPAAVIGIGASAGGIAPLQQFFADMKPDSGLAFVVVMHLSPEHESQLANVIQQKTRMPVTQVTEPVKVRPNHVYVIPPNNQLTFNESTLELVPPQRGIGRRITIDLFFRTLAMAYGQRAVCVIMSGTDSDGVIGLKHIRAQGGLTIVQDPNEAEYDSMPATAISTGMADWVLPVARMPEKLLEFVKNENAMRLPPELEDADEPDAKEKEAPGGETVSDETRDREDEDALVQVLADVRAQTGHDFSHYKRATILRRVARRMQVNSLESIPQYLEFVRTHPAEARALLQDLLIGVTHFFRDREAFAALEANVPQLFAGKRNGDELRVWVAGCATGEEAYSIAMLLCEQCARLENPPTIQVFATDIDEESIADARDGLYPSMIEADVSPERLREFFVKDHGRYRVRKEIREKVLFARHNLLSDAPFSRCDLISCRNLLIYLNGTAQKEVFDIFHFALKAGGMLFLGGAENDSQGDTLFSPVDSKHRIFVRRSTPRPMWKVPMVPARPPEVRVRRPNGWRARPLPALTHDVAHNAANINAVAAEAGHTRREVLFGELHLRLLEQYGPASVVVNETHDIVHLSESAGRYLHFVGGEPTANIAKVVNPALQLELRTALFKAAQTKQTVRSTPTDVEIGGATETITLEVRPMDGKDQAAGFYLVLFNKEENARDGDGTAVSTAHATALLSHEAEDEIQLLKQQLGSTVEQYEAANEELKASNEELQAMNEEMRSATEELETSKEELQSVNEELVTVNHELKSNVEELSRTNADLNNLMASSDIGTVFLDRQLRVHRFTPAAQKIFNLIAADMGRPISDITSRLHYDGFIADVEKVLADLHTIEREVTVGDDNDWYLTRIAPYRTNEDRIAGVVATFVNITQRKQAEAKVTAGAIRYRTLFDLVPVAVYTTDAEGNIEEFNQRAVEMWGRTPAARGEKFCGSFKIYHPEGRPMRHDDCPMARVLRGEELETSELEILVEQENGAQRNVVAAPRVVRDEHGRIAGAINCLYDITERKHAEELLRESEERFRTIAHNVPQVIWTNDAKGEANYFNNRWFEFTGLSYEESRGPGWQAVVHPDDAPASREKWQQALANGDVLDTEYRLRGADGEYRWFIGRNVPLKDAQGRVTSWFGTATDIQDLKETEAALRQSEARFRAMFEQANVGIVQIDSDNRFISVNPGFCAIVGYTETELRKMRVPDVTDADDWKEEQKLTRQLSAGEIPEYTIEKRYRRKDGELVWGSMTTTLVRGDEDSPLYTLAIVQMIGERKQAEEQLRSSEERYRLLVDGARDYAIFLLNPSNEIVYWSAGAERVFGWSAEEAIGQSGELVFTPEDREREEEEKEIAIALKDGIASDRRWHLRKDGTRIWVDGVMHRLEDEKTGALRGFAKVARDRTEARRAEEQLQRAHEELEQRVRERTAELQANNRLLKQEVERRQMLENEILRITERERARIGQDLHDSLCQELTATAFLLKSRAKAIAPQNKAASDSLAEAAETVNNNAGLARDLARGLHPFELGSAGLPSALRELCSRTNDAVSCRCDCPRSLRLDQNVAVNLYRIAQEAITNSVKHAKANEIVISLERTNGEIILAISDDGQGKRKRGRGLGTHIMQYRARAAGGTLEVESARGRGTTVMCRVPLKRST